MFVLNLCYWVSCYLNKDFFRRIPWLLWVQTKETHSHMLWFLDPSHAWDSLLTSCIKIEAGVRWSGEGSCVALHSPSLCIILGWGYLTDQLPQLVHPLVNGMGWAMTPDCHSRKAWGKTLCLNENSHHHLKTSDVMSPPTWMPIITNSIFPFTSQTLSLLWIPSRCTEMIFLLYHVVSPMLGT